MFRRFMIVCWVLFAFTTVVSILGYAGHKFYEKKMGELLEMGYNPFSTYDGNRFIDLYPDDSLLLIAQNREQEVRSGTGDDTLVDDQKTEGENGRTYSDIPAGFKVVEPDSTDWLDAPIVDEDEVREQKQRFAAMAELDRRYHSRQEVYQIAGFIGGGLDGSLKGSNLGTVAFEVISVTQLTGVSSSSLPQVEIEILDANVVCEGDVFRILDAPEPISSSEPFDVMP